MTTRLGGYEVLEELPGGSFHARSEAGLEVRLTPRPSPLPLPLPPLLAPHPHVAEVLEVRPELVVSTWVPGVSLRELTERARRRGLLTLPPFLSVSLLQQVCRGLQHAHANGAVVPGEVGLHSVVVGFDGRVRVTCFGAPERDVPAAALVLDQLLEETLDAELIGIVAEAREPEATRRVPTALSLEQRLGHWQVKQRQLFPRHQLVRELVAWLWPTEAQREASEEVAAWLENECTGPVRAEPPSRARGAAAPKSPRLIGALLTLLGLGAGAFFAFEKLVIRLPAAGHPHAVELLAPVPLPAAPPQTREPARAEREPAPPLPRWGKGAPATVLLSSKVHGVLLETSGFGVNAPSPRWAVKTVRMRSNAPAPSYASLFVAEFDGNNRLERLGQIGPTWLSLSQPSARFFAMQTDQPADDGSFGLTFATREGRLFTPQPKLLRADVLTDSMTNLEYRRFVLEGLDPKVSYQVSQRLNPQGPTPPVIVTATIPRAVDRTWVHSGFQRRGAPLDQVLLQPAVTMMVKDASRLSFVVLTTQGAPEVTTSIEVNPASPLAGALQPSPADASLTEGLIRDGKKLMKRRDYRSAALVFEQCVQLDPTDFECQRLRAAALASAK